MTEKLIYKNKYLNITKSKDYYFYDENETQVMVLPVINKKKFIFVKQYRKPLNKFTYEFPAGGCLDKTEKPLDAAIRELKEETGISIRKNKINKLNTVSANPQRQEKLVHIFLANIDLKEFKNRSKVKSHEINTIETKSLKEVVSMFKNRKIVSGVVGFVFLNYLINHKKII
jgi:ADP-ribose pyrophosphatase